MLYEIGEQPGPGTYQCMVCLEQVVVLDDIAKILPFCENCGASEIGIYRKLGDPQEDLPEL